MASVIEASGKEDLAHIQKETVDSTHDTNGADADDYIPATEYIFSNATSSEEVANRARQLAIDAGLTEYEEVLVRGARLAHEPKAYYASATEADKQVLRDEVQHRFRQPFGVWWVSVVGALAAMVQGMDETVTSGAQLFFLKYFNLENNDVLIGFVNASPYLMCATLGCWLAIPSNNYFGRRGTIFIFSIVSVAASLWQAAAHTWKVFLGGRLLLGISIGANSATVAVYTAECTPASIRGGLVLFWQIFVAFGIMIGYLMGVAFLKVTYPLNWRLMVGSTFVAPLVVISALYVGPESPRYLVSKRRYGAAFKSLLRLRHSELQSARDLYLITEAVKVEEHLRSGRNFFSDVRDIATVPRVRYAALSSWFIMFMQNFCGINAMTYYTGQVFVDTGVSAETAIYASVGAGALGCFAALPAIKYMDIWGRRTLLLGSLVCMSACTLFVGFSFLAPNQKERLALVATGIYLYQAAYAPGQGPVPFVYASEAYPLYMRSLGMSFSASTTWFFSFILTLSWPSQLRSMTVTGAFCFFSAWSIVGAIIIYFFVPETKGLTLEELDFVFNVPIAVHGQNKLQQLQHWLKMRPDPPKDIRLLSREHFAAITEGTVVAEGYDNQKGNSSDEKGV